MEAGMGSDVPGGWMWKKPSYEEANHVLAVAHGQGGFKPGGFTTGLILLMLSADQSNLAKLADGFPGYASAVRSYKFDGDWFGRLAEIADTPPERRR
jgi:hypothetical protein